MISISWYIMPDFNHYNILGTLDPTDPLYEHLDRCDIDEFGMDELVTRLSAGLPQEVFLVVGKDRTLIPDAYGRGEIALDVGPTGIINNMNIKAQPFMVYPSLSASRLQFQAGDNILYTAPKQDMRTQIAL